MLLTFISFLFISFSFNVLFYKIFKKIEKLTDSPLEKSHKIHNFKAIRCGGMAIFLTVLISILFINAEYRKFIVISSIAFLIGTLEDIYKNISPKTRFIILTITSFLMVLFEPKIILTNFEIINLPYWFALLFIIFAITGFSNSINIIDGINGLSSGIIINGLLFISFIAYINSDYETLKFTIILLSSLLGFFIINFFTGKIFLGDGGAYFIGIIVSSICLYISNNYLKISPWFFLVVFGYPVTDTLFSIFRRYIKNKDILRADILHMHSLINKRIFKSHIKTSFLIIITSFLFSIFAIKFKTNTLALILLYVTYVIVYVTSYLMIIKKYKPVKS